MSTPCSRMLHLGDLKTPANLRACCRSRFKYKCDSPQTIKQHLAAIKMLFDYLVISRNWPLARQHLSVNTPVPAALIQSLALGFLVYIVVAIFSCPLKDKGNIVSQRLLPRK